MITYLVAHLKADVALAALIGTRLWSNVLPQGGPLPAIAFQQISRAPVHHRSGADGLATDRWQFACNARSYPAARQVADALIVALQAFKRSATPKVSVTWVESVSDDVEPGYDAAGDYFRVLVDALIQHEE
jgi:hypothetical protein